MEDFRVHSKKAAYSSFIASRQLQKIEQRNLIQLAENSPYVTFSGLIGVSSMVLRCLEGVLLVLVL